MCFFNEGGSVKTWVIHSLFGSKERFKTERFRAQSLRAVH